MIALLFAVGLASLLAAPTASAAATDVLGTDAIDAKGTPADCTSQAGPDDTSHWCCYRDPYGEEHCDEYERYCYYTEEGQRACGGWVREWQCVRTPGGPWYCERSDGLQCRQTPQGWDCRYPKQTFIAMDIATGPVTLTPS